MRSNKISPKLQYYLKIEEEKNSKIREKADPTNQRETQTRHFNNH